MADWGRAQDVAKNGRLARRAQRLRRGGGRLWLAGLAIAGASLAPSAGAYAAVGEKSIVAGPLGTAVATGETLISPQYQAKNADTAVGTGPHGPAADPSGGDAPHVAAWTGLSGRSGPTADSARRRGPAAAWYRTRALQYQLRGNMSDLPKGRIALNGTKSSDANPQTNDRSIVSRIHHDKVISNATTGLDPQDARRLLQLGVFLAIVYVLFVLFWLWRMRGRPYGAGRVVRS